MSNAAMLTLPRFDESVDRVDASCHTSSDDVPAPIVSQPDFETIDPDDMGCAASGTPAELNTLQDPMFGKVEQLIDAMNTALNDLDTKFSQHVTTSLQGVVHDFLPLLSDSFLAEEIARHLPALLPGGSAQLEIHAAPALATYLRASIDRRPALSAVCEIIESQDGSETSVQLSWPMGGGVLNYNSLLAASLARLNLTAE